MVSWESEQEKELIKEEIRGKIGKRFENISTKDLIMLSELKIVVTPVMTSKI